MVMLLRQPPESLTVNSVVRARLERPQPFAWLFLFLMLLLIWVPIPIGSNRPWSQGLLTAVALTLAGLWVFAYARSPFDVPITLRALKLPGYLFGTWVLYPIFQLLPFPTALVDITGTQLNGHDLTIVGAGASSMGYLSIDRDATIGGFLNQMGFVAVFFLVMALTTSHQRLNRLMLILGGVGIVEALYGLVLYFSGGDTGLWDPGHMPTTVSGTFINQNHFAGLMELTIPVVIGLVIAEGGFHGVRRGATSFAWRLTELALSRRGILTFFLVVMISALILTTSRGAIGALFIAISGTFLLAARKRGSRPSEFRVGLALICLVVVSMAWLGTGEFLEKVRESGFESNRGDLRDVSYRMIKDNPIVGTGVGTYRWAFPVYKDERFGSGFYEHAHNDFLEILGEQGLVGFLLIFGAIFIVLCRIGRALMRRQDPLIRGGLFAGFAGCSSLLIHGLVDFNLQIPANASFFFALLGIGLVASNLEGPHEGG